MSRSGCNADVQVSFGAHVGSSIGEQVESCIKLASYDWLTLLPGMLNVLCVCTLTMCCEQPVEVMFAARDSMANIQT